MAGRKPELGTKEDVISWYDSRENECYFIFIGEKIGKEVFAKYVGDDTNVGRDRLVNSLQFIESNANNSNIYTIVAFNYYEGSESIKTTNVEGETVRFQLHNSFYSQNKEVFTPALIDNKATLDEPSRLMFSFMEKQNAKLQEELNQLRERLEEQEEEEAIEPPVINGKDRLLNSLAGMIESPMFTETVLTIGAGLINGLMQKFNNNGSTSNRSEGLN